MDIFTSLKIAPAFTLDCYGEWSYQYLSKTLQYSTEFQQVIFDLEHAHESIAETLSSQARTDLENLLSNMKKMHLTRRLYFKFLSNFNALPFIPKAHQEEAIVIRNKINELQAIADHGEPSAIQLKQKLISEDPLPTIAYNVPIEFSPLLTIGSPLFFYDPSLFFETGYISYREENVIGAFLDLDIFSSNKLTLKYLTDGGKKVAYSTLSPSGLCEIEGRATFCSLESMKEAILSQVSSVDFKRMNQITL